MHRVTVRNGSARSAKPGVHRRAEFYYQQLDALRLLRQAVRRDLLLEVKKHQAWKLLRQIPGIGPIRAAVLMAADADASSLPHQATAVDLQWVWGWKRMTAESTARSKGSSQRAKKQATVRGLNRDHNHDLKDIFKGAAMRASSRGRTAARFLREFTR